MHCRACCCFGAAAVLLLCWPAPLCPVPRHPLAAVHMTAVDVRSVGNKGFAPLAIGFTVFLGHAVLLNV